MSCPRIKLSISQSLILDGVETGVSLSDFAQQLCRNNADVLVICSALFNAAGISSTLVLNQNATANETAGSFPKSERQKLQWFYAKSGAAYGFVRNLMEASNLPLSKVRQFLHSNGPYAKFTLVTNKFKRMKALDRFKNDVRYMDLAHVDKLAKDNNGVKY